MEGEESGGTIIRQLKPHGRLLRLGARALHDGPRALAAAVREVFVRLYEAGLIYRGNRIINWCPRCATALSDIEVEHEGSRHLWHIRYPLKDRLAA